MTRATITHDDLRETRRRIEAYIHHTPVLTSRSLNERVGAEVYVKCESFQRAGSFKIRGATNFISRLSPEEIKRGVVAHSSGNHAQAVALAARTFGARCYIVMPKDAPAIKRQATEGYGAEITLCEPNLESRETVTQKIIDRTGAVLVHPYDHDWTIMGQSTVAQELLEDVPDLDAILVPVSGGGLLAGTCLAAAYHSADIQVYGCEPALADDAYESFRTGKLSSKKPGPTMADGLRAVLCERTFAIIQEYAAGIVRATEDEIRDAMRFYWERMKVVVEPSGATSLAPLLFQRDEIKGKRVGIIASGGNVDFPL